MCSAAFFIWPRWFTIFEFETRAVCLAGGRRLCCWRFFYVLSNSKEMAVTLPVMLLVYELIYHRPGEWKGPAVAAWLRGPAQTALLAALLCAVDVFGKNLRPRALVQAEAYHPVFNLQRVRAFQRMALSDLLFGWGSGWGGILLLFALLGFLAWRREERRELRFLWCFF